MPLVGRNLSPVIVAVTVAQAVAIIGYSTAVQWKVSFATLSNLSYVFSGLYVHFAITPRGGALVSPAFPLLFLGSSSFAFHGDLGNGSKHSLDIFGGWVIVTHLAAAAIHAALTEILIELKPTRLFVFVADWIFVALFTTTFFAIAFAYATVYSHQLEFYLGCAGVAIVASMLVRVRLALLQSRSASIAIFEAVCAFVVAISAVVVQGSLLGRKSTYNNDPGRYDLQHGCWHIQLALVVSLLNVRYRDILDQSLQPIDEQDHILDLTVLDAFGLLCNTIQALVVMILKETEADEEVIAATIWTGTAFLAVHAGRFSYVRVTGARPLQISKVVATAASPEDLPFLSVR